MELHFEPVTSANRSEVLKLRVAKGQEGFVETTAQCLAEAERRRCWRPVGIYDGRTLVGFAMYGFFWEYPPTGRLWLDRLLIDGSCQGKGYGRAALTGLLDRLALEYPLRRKIYLSVVEENAAAAELYARFGFRYSGELDVHGERVMIRKT